jgi:hypothetical protein
MSRAITLLPLWAFGTCSRANFTLCGMFEQITVSSSKDLEKDRPDPRRSPYPAVACKWLHISKEQAPCREATNCADNQETFGILYDTKVYPSLIP